MMAAELRQMSQRVGRLEAQLQNQGLLNLLNQIEAQKVELARLRGSQEEMAHVQQQADRRQKELFADFDVRLRELANRPPPPPSDNMRLQPSPNLISSAPVAVRAAPAPAADPEAESRTYNQAMRLVNSGDYPGAIKAFTTFLEQYPTGPLSSNGHYWLGLSHAALRDHKSAVASYLRLLKDFPLSDKVPDTMLSLSRAYVQMGETDRARAQLDELIRRFPITKAAADARKLHGELN
jgi:tol-pal system protein YbgF